MPRAGNAGGRSDRGNTPADRPRERARREAELLVRLAERIKKESLDQGLPARLVELEKDPSQNPQLAALFGMLREKEVSDRERARLDSDLKALIAHRPQGGESDDRLLKI